MENYVDVLNVTQSFHGRKALDNVTVSFCEGKIHGVIGNNGSGKTVLFKTICGFLTPQKGEVYVRGQRVGKDFDFPPDIGTLIESPGFLPNEDAYHTLAHLWSMRGKPDYAQIEKTLHMVGLSDVGKKKVGNFMQIVSSYGVEIKKKNIPLRATLDIFRKAVSYLIPVYAKTCGS